MANKKNKKGSGIAGKTKSLTRKKIKPLDPELGQVMQQAIQNHQAKQYQHAEKGYRYVISKRPDFADAYQYLGLLAHHVKQSDQAIALFERAVELDPNNVSIISNFGVVLFESNKFSAARKQYERAVKLQPRFADGHYNLAKVYQELNLLELALDSFTQALKLDPKNAEACNNRGNVNSDLCLWSDALSDFRRSMTLSPGNVQAASNLMLTSNYMAELSAKEVFEMHREAASAFPSADEFSFPAHNKTSRLRVGYVSSDFRAHSVAYFFYPLLAAHDTSHFEIFCYSTGKEHDEMTAEIQSSTEHWRECQQLSDRQLLEIIRADKLDVLVDLNGHTGANRLRVFAKRAAPKQLTWLGYPNTTALPAMDYRIVDSITDPLDVAESLCTEKLLRLDDGFLCYHGDTTLDYERKLPCEEGSGFTFGSFNNLAKVNEIVVEKWAAILSAVPDSKLVVKAKQLADDGTRERIANLFQSHGVDLSRLELLSTLPSRTEHLNLYSQIDLALDTFPYNGTTTTFEALWMGVPTLTILGDRHAARVGASIMTRLDLESFVASNTEDYVSRAVELASNHQELADIRQTLRDRLLGSPLCDCDRFARELENAFTAIVE